MIKVFYIPYTFLDAETVAINIYSTFTNITTFWLAHNKIKTILYLLLNTTFIPNNFINVFVGLPDSRFIGKLISKYI